MFLVIRSKVLQGRVQDGFEFSSFDNLCRFTKHGCQDLIVNNGGGYCRPAFLTAVVVGIAIIAIVVVGHRRRGGGSEFFLNHVS